MEEEITQSAECFEQTQRTNYSSQSSVPSSEFEDDMTIDDILGSFLHSVEICEQSSEDQEKFLDKILASQEPSEPDCLRQLQLFIERESYKVIDLTESDSNGEPAEQQQWPNEAQWPNEEQWQNVADEFKIKLEAKEEPKDIEDFELFKKPSSSKSKIKREMSEEERHREKSKRKYRERAYKERKIKLLPKKFNLRPRANHYWNEENILYIKTQENIYSYWETHKKSKTPCFRQHKKESK